MQDSAQQQMPVAFMRDDEDYVQFAKAFLNRYLSAGFASLPKTEIDLLVLELLYGQWCDPKSGSQDSDGPSDSLFGLARELKISPRRLRSKLDVLAFRQPPETPQETLRAILSSGQLEKDGTQVKIQITDGFVREFAKDIVRQELRIVDTSFNTEIMVLSHDSFLLLATKTLNSEDYEVLSSYTKSGLQRLLKGLGKEVKKEARQEIVSAARELLAKNFSVFAAHLQQIPM